MNNVNFRELRNRQLQILRGSWQMILGAGKEKEKDIRKRKEIGCSLLGG